MKVLKKTEVFNTWLSKLKDDKGKAKITDRIMRLKRGNKGDYPAQSTKIFTNCVYTSVPAIEYTAPTGITKLFYC